MRLFNIFMALCIPVKWAATAFPPGGPQSSPISSKDDNLIKRSRIWNLKLYNSENYTTSNLILLVEQSKNVLSVFNLESILAKKW